MKKILCIAVLLISVESAYAQLYVRGNIGYNLPANTQIIGSDYKDVLNEVTDEWETKDKGVYGSYGSGLSFQFGVGASFGGSLGYDVEVGYLVGKQYSSSYYYSYPGVTDNEKTKTSSNSFQISPSLTFTAGTGNVQPYTRMGPVIAFSNLKIEETEFSTYSNQLTVEKIEYTGGMNLGFKGVLGVNFNATKNLQFFSEVSYVGLTYAPKQGETTGYTINGQDSMDSLNPEDKKWKFKDSVDYNNADRLREKYTMSSIGIQVGVKFLLM